MLSDYEIHISIGGFEEKWVSTPAAVRRFWASTEQKKTDVPGCRVRYLSQTRKIQ